MSKGKPSRKQSFLGELNRSLKSPLELLQNRTSFSFQFFDNSQDAGADFSKLTNKQLVKLCEKLKAYCKESLEHWQRERIGKGTSHVFERYGEFPARSDFTRPSNIPADVVWARFRLEADFRIAGFVVNEQDADRLRLSKDTFYIVFIDPEHKFYIMSK